MNPMDFFKNASAIKEQVEVVQEKLKDISATGNSGGGIVRVTVNGRLEMIDIELDPIAVDPRDIEMLQDLIVAAHTDAMAKVQDAMRAKLGPLLGGMNLPNFSE